MGNLCNRVLLSPQDYSAAGVRKVLAAYRASLSAGTAVATATRTHAGEVDSAEVPFIANISRCALGRPACEWILPGTKYLFAATGSRDPAPERSTSVRVFDRTPGTLCVLFWSSEIGPVDCTQDPLFGRRIH